MFPRRIFRLSFGRLIARAAVVVLFGTTVSSAAHSDSLGHAVLRYRMQVYESYRLNRPQLDRHLQAGNALISAWRDRGSPLEEVDEMIDWFQRATWAVRSGQPALPKYSYVSSVIAPAPPEHPVPAQPVAAPAIAAITDASAIPDASAGRLPPDVARDVPRSVRPAHSSSPPSSTARAPRVAESRRRPALPDAAPDDLPPLNPSDIVPERPVENSTFVADQLPRVRLHLAPPRDDSHPALPASPAPPTPLSHNPASRRGASTSNRGVDVNVQVLSAKIRSTNLSLTAIEGELAASSSWTVDQLESITQDLASLLDAANLARMYYEALSSSQRREVEPPLDAGPIRALLAQRLFETRVDLADRAQSAPSAALDEQRGRLETLFEQIQRWDGDDLQ